MAVKIDRETLAITALVGAMVIYLFTKKDATQQQLEDDTSKTEVDELRSHLEQLEGRYDALDGELERSSPDHELPQWVSVELNEIARDVNQLGRNASGVEVGEGWWERHSQLEASCGDHLRAHGEEMEIRGRFKAQNDRQGTTRPHVTLVSNHLYAQQNVDRRTVHAVKMEDNRTFQAAHRHIHMSVNALPTGDHEFMSGGPSGSAAIRDQQAHNTRTSTNAIENKRPVIVAEWGDVTLLETERRSNDPLAITGPQARQPLAITASPDPFISPQNSFESAPKEGRDNEDKPPGEVQNQVALLQPISRDTEQNFNTEVMDDEVPKTTHLAQGQLQLREFEIIMAQMDGLIDALRDSDETSGTGYTVQRRKIKALISAHDQKYYSGMFSSEYGRRRDNWNGRLKKIDRRGKSIERRHSGSVHRLSAAESRRKREGERKATRSSERVLSMDKRRKTSPPSYSTDSDFPRLGGPEEVTQLNIHGPPSPLYHPSLTRSRSPSTSYDDFTQGGRSTGGIHQRGGGV